MCVGGEAGLDGVGWGLLGRVPVAREKGSLEQLIKLEVTYYSCKNTGSDSEPGVGLEPRFPRFWCSWSRQSSE